MDGGSWISPRYPRLATQSAFMSAKVSQLALKNKRRGPMWDRAVCDDDETS